MISTGWQGNLLARHIQWIMDWECCFSHKLSLSYSNSSPQWEQCAVVQEHYTTFVISAYATRSAWLNLCTRFSPDWVSTPNPNSLNSPLVANTSEVIRHIKAMAQRSWLVIRNPFSNSSMPFIGKVKTPERGKVFYCTTANSNSKLSMWYYSSRKEYSIFAEKAVVLLLPLHKILSHKIIYMQLISPQYGMQTVFWFGICWWTGGLWFPDTAVLTLLWEQE